MAAATDAISHLGLGRVFPANMTGNTVLLGLGIATGDVAASARAAVALAGFVAAAGAAGVAGAAGAVLPRERWSRATANVLALETAVLATTATWWHADASHLGDVTRYALIGLNGAAMGLKSSAIATLGFTGIATTYISGTWTSLACRVGARLLGRDDLRESRADARRQLLVVSSYPVVACGAGALFARAGSPAMLVPIALLALVRTVPRGGTVRTRSPMASSARRPIASVRTSPTTNVLSSSSATCLGPTDRRRQLHAGSVPRSSHRTLRRLDHGAIRPSTGGRVRHGVGYGPIRDRGRT